MIVAWGAFSIVISIYFCIFAVSAIGGMFTERSGIVNIGINGVMIIGAVTYLVITQIMSKIFPIDIQKSMFWQLLLFPISGLVGMLFSTLLGFATIKLKSDHTISGFAINLLAFGIALILLIIFGNNTNTPNNNVTEMAAYVEVSGTKFEIISLKLVITILIVIISYLMLYKTAWGLRFRSVGENPNASDVAGINVNSIKWQGVLISGFLSGLAGSFFAQSSRLSFTGEVNGLGYLALAIMIMGQWNVWLITLSSFVYSLLFGLADLSGYVKSVEAFAYLFRTIPYLGTLIMVIIMGKKTRAPAAAGIIYDKSKR
ncbi:ABC transporter permease [Mycoplasmopsis lipofaciens]|uniref:ABC transporter permease n=1 Tax=Mycoplasmopsis lipofaciens TaxID=114884 RepID=UPI00055F78B5|nr:ABC transporter permease [Mycoplasmopsis lipofaciens]